MTLLAKRGIAAYLGCEDARCTTAPIERIRNLDGSITMRCAHKDRILSRAI